VPQDPAQEEDGAAPIGRRIGIRRVNGRYQMDELWLRGRRCAAPRTGINDA